MAQYGVEVCKGFCPKRTDICHATCEEYHLEVMATRILNAGIKADAKAKKDADAYVLRRTRHFAYVNKGGADGR